MKEIGLVLALCAGLFAAWASFGTARVIQETAAQLGPNR